MSPIEAKEFDDKGKEVEAKSRVDRKGEIEAFLKARSQKAYTQKEIADEFGVASNQARGTLMKLIDEGKVSRKSVEVDGKPLIHYAWIPLARQKTSEEA